MECVSGGTKGGVQYMGYGAMARLHASVREATPA